MQRKKLKGFLPVCMAVITALLPCASAMAGGYFASSELKVNLIGIRPWPEETVAADETLFAIQPIPPEEYPSTPSDASKSNAFKGKRASSLEAKGSSSLDNASSSNVRASSSNVSR